MARFRNILVAADFSEGSKRAFATACSLAGEGAAQMTVLKVRAAEPSTGAPDSEVLDRLRSQYVPDRPLETEYFVRSGDPASVILEEVARLDADLVAMGTHGRTGLGRLLTGSVAEAVLRRAPCPVLAMRSSETLDGKSAVHIPPDTVRRILHATDFSESTGIALEVARDLARDQGAQLSLLHVVPMISVLHVREQVPAEDPELCLANLRALSERLDDAGLKFPVATILKYGQSAEEILQSAEDLGCDVLIMGTHGRTGLGRLLMGSVAELVLRQAQCPVLLVKSVPAESTTAGNSASGAAAG